MPSDKFYYITAASGKKFIQEYAYYSIKSLLRAGIHPDLIHVAGNTTKDYGLLKSLFPEINVYLVNENLKKVKWQYDGGKRKYSLFKASALCHIFPKPIVGKYMVYFDGDVLWYDNPTSFFLKKCVKTWFHHGKDLKKRSIAGRKGLTIKDIDVHSYKSLSQWVSEPQAYLMVKWGCEIVPEREVVAGLYIMHPSDHEKIIEYTYKGCLMNSKKFIHHEGVGDQKPMNAALASLNVDWHGGSRFFCPEHQAYFDHFFGSKQLKKSFQTTIKKMNL